MDAKYKGFTVHPEASRKESQGRNVDLRTILASKLLTQMHTCMQANTDGYIHAQFKGLQSIRYYISFKYSRFQLTPCTQIVARSAGTTITIFSNIIYTRIIPLHVSF